MVTTKPPSILLTFGLSRLLYRTTLWNNVLVILPCWRSSWVTVDFSTIPVFWGLYGPDALHSGSTPILIKTPTYLNLERCALSFILCGEGILTMALYWKHGLTSFILLNLSLSGTRLNTHPFHTYRIVQLVYRFQFIVLFPVLENYFPDFFEFPQFFFLENNRSLVHLYT